MFGLRRNAVIGLNLYCGGASLGAGGGSPAGARLTAEEAKARREGGGEAALLPGARGVARPPPVGAEDPDVPAPAERRLLRSPGLLAVPPDEMAAPAAAAAAAIMSPEEELDGCEPEALGKRPAVLPLLERVSEAAKSSGADGSLPSTPPPAEEDDDDDDELYRQSLEIITRYLREQAAGAKDTKPLGEAGAAGRRALETLRRVGDGVQRNHETAFQGWVCGVLPRTGPRRRHQKCAAGLCGCCWSRGWSGIPNKIAL
ncbi:induced myeloid leukemia cell differentiation protein Mcl-1 isoform X2 [Peromyscus californicus insignis]|uniref:induced myeloid leukemia cell differentiation protein Mcl-1 isoform X2 n=1 Tax=Peromyscus californicus insignis TaxID=564181 RepID=UPI0022A66645|nr:induced myeloid leukemia cell differentiation protein Mcl-1 isoform X2 [Peromyscus californicus insignis]